MRILILDSDESLTKTLVYSMMQEDYEVSTALDASDALKKIKTKKFDIVVCDIELNGKKDISIIQDIRRFSTIPIIVISNIKDDIDKIVSFDYGADDYIVKPFNPLELKVRIKAIQRRQNTEKKDHESGDILFGDYRVKTLGRSLVKGDKVIPLTGKEFDLLYVLCSNPGKIFSREDLLNLVWGYEFYGDLRSVDVHVVRLRRKIEQNTKKPKYIHTKYGVGYYFKDTEQ